MDSLTDAIRLLPKKKDPTAANINGRLITVIIPAYNAAAYIVETLNSVFKQTFLDYEVILVNDGSPDTLDLEAVLRPYLPRITYIKQENCGPSSARNTAILKARGKYLAFLDSDDYWLPRHLEQQVALFKRDPALDLIYSDCFLLQNGLPVGKAFDFEPQSTPVTFQSLLLFECTISTSSTVASRQFILEVNMFDESLTRCEDYDLWLRMAHRGARIGYHCDPQVYHRRSNSLSADCLLMWQARIQVYNKLSKELTLSDLESETIKNQIAKTQVDYFTEVSKRALVKRNFGEALNAAKHANSVISNWKLRVAVAGLAVAPSIFFVFYKLYELGLDIRNRHRTTKRIKHLDPSERVNGSLFKVAAE